MSSTPDTTESSRITADASRDAARMQAESTDKALALQSDMFGKQQDYLKEQDVYNRGITQQNQANYNPYIQAGQGGLAQMTGAMNDPGSWLNKKFGQEDLNNDDGYQFRLNEGQNSLNKSLAAGGGLLSGAAAKATMKYNQGMASDEYNNAYSRFTNDKNNRYAQLSNLTGLGLAGAAGFAGGSPGSTTGTQMANIAGQNSQMAGGIIQSGANAQSNITMANAQQQAQYALMGQGGGGRGMMGALGGAAAGAQMGSVIPGIGTAVGAGIGALASFL